MSLRVLVSGGAGFIGSTVVPRLLDEGCTVAVLDRFYFGTDALAPAQKKHGDRLRLLRGDVRRANASHFEGIDAFVDLAGISNDPSCELDPKLTRQVNYEACVRMADLAVAAGVKRIVFASSCSVYGHGETTALTESSPLHPVSLYAKCKADAEADLLAIGRERGLPVTALRFATLFGVSGRTRFDVAVNVMTKNAYVDRKITVEGGGRQWRPFVHVRDVAEAVHRVLVAPAARIGGEVFNVGSDQANIRIQNLAYRVRDHVPGTEIMMAPTDPDLRDYNVSFEKIASVLGFTPAVSIDEGIDEVLEALRSGRIDPHDRRWYTLKQYTFLSEVERTFRKLEIDGHVLELGEDS